MSSPMLIDFERFAKFQVRLSFIFPMPVTMTTNKTNLVTTLMFASNVKHNSD